MNTVGILLIGITSVHYASTHSIGILTFFIDLVLYKFQYSKDETELHLLKLVK